MPITINGSGTVTGISTGGLPDGCIATDDLANNAVTAGKMGATEQSRLCAAFVNFNGTGTVAIRASYNVSSITDNGVGDYTVNFTTAMVDANYAVTWSFGGTGGVLAGRTLEDTTPRTTLLIRLITTNNAFALADAAQVNVAIFR